MVMLLHLGCIQRNEWSRRTFRSLIFYIMYHFFGHCKDRFGIHVNIRTVCYICGHWYVYDVFTYVPVSYRSYST